MFPMEKSLQHLLKGRYFSFSLYCGVAYNVLFNIRPRASPEDIDVDRLRAQLYRSDAENESYRFETSMFFFFSLSLSLF